MTTAKLTKLETIQFDRKQNRLIGSWATSIANDLWPKLKNRNQFDRFELIAKQAMLVAYDVVEFRFRLASSIYNRMS